MRIKNKKNVIWEFTEKSDFYGGGRVHEKNNIYGGDCLKRRTWTVCRFKRRLGEKKRVVFLRGFDTSMHTRKKETLVQVFSCQFCKKKIQNTCFNRTPPVAASEDSQYLKSISLFWATLDILILLFTSFIYHY